MAGSFHGQVTEIVLAKFMPIPTFASDVMNDLSSLSAEEKNPSLGFLSANIHCGGAPTSFTGFLSAKPKSMKNSGS
jgi:hypothetical protein